MKNYTLEKHNMLTIIKEVDSHIYPSGAKRRKFLCKCDCGKETYVLINLILNGSTKSCGCYNIEKNITHGLNRTRIQRIFNGIRQRCNNINVPEYKDYGGRGIKCVWETLGDFRKDMKEGYTDNLTIERINNNGNYCKQNCKWATMKEQAQNRRHRTIIFYNGISRSKTEWAKYFGVSYHCFKNRLNRAGNFENMILKYNIK